MGDFFLGKVYFTSPLLLMHWTSVCGHTVRQKRGMSNRVVCHFDLNSITLLSTNRGHKTVLLEAKMKTLKPNPYFKVHYHSYNAGFDCKKGHSSTHIQLYMIVSVVSVSGVKSGHLVKILDPFFQMCLGQMQQQHIQSMTSHLINVSTRL